MKKEYQKPDVKEVALVAEEIITTGDELLDGEMGLESAGDLFG